ncbi:uncharacterized protein N7479_002058 [Penicillium vulpinum]|uniref:AGC-kinase C-terminal domain-containing protein n=1 Tax=Penicillium vulpinum TaxID=29845 RepID=A0A1V6S4W3_9EURO|nr:uncharacterized protein N7479_002058 [Penicillium vulpinum]KAJ5972140.1 hypothetical protein N7479_002058 [Penicillium vulpinum]OQE08759.1 hypothetical protein PENVUL_c008G00223 [Penicillium vulpinum]
MPSSTVFSYWRRDHRRSSASPASIPALSAVKVANGSPTTSPPQLPDIPDTPTLTTTFDGRPSPDGPSSNESPPDIDTSKLNISSSVAPLSSSLNLGVPSQAFEKESRPHSSPGDCGEEQFTSQSNNSQLSVTVLRSDQGDVESNFKPSSPFRRSFAKQKRSPTAVTGSGHFRFRSSSEDSPADKQTMPPKDFKMDGSTNVRRTGDRDVSVEQTHHKSGKAMLHLLNPMSLLARRRSSQIVSSRAEDLKLNNRNVPAIPDDYDPRIRGKIVHDFSAPRPRRNLSATQHDIIVNGQDTSPPHIPTQPRGARWNDQAKRYSDHSPVFKEHFEDQNVLQVEHKGYLQSSLLTGQSQPGNDSSLPVFARNLPSHLPERTIDISEQLEPGVAELLSSPPKATSHAHPQHPQDQDTIPNAPFNPSAIPKHLKSNASQFSFDMSGVDSSSQEKMLEEKHKAKEASRRMEDGYFDDFDEDFDDDMMDDLDGLEERIPGVNADAEDDDFDDFSISRNINETKSWAVPGLSPVADSPITAAQPDPTTASYFTSHLSEATQLNDGPNRQLPQEQPSLLARTDAISTIPQAPIAKQAASILDDDDDDDDLYFDDGDFGELDAENQDGGFDESIFDDVNSHLYERKLVNAPVAPLPMDSAAPGGNDASAEKESPVVERGVQGLQHMPSVASDYRVTGSVKRGPLGEPIPNMGPARAHGGVLTEQNLDILHNALAFAANEAAYSGRFERKFSVSERSQGQDSAAQTSQTIDSQPGLISDDSRISQAADAMAFEDVFDDHFYDNQFYDDNDDSYLDDAIVAAANAEALENDEDGFYGQEFGFYAQADGNGTSELTNGGYFGPRRVGGITRNHSSRGKFQEPSLTPITERSEWSTRNSMISVKAHGGTHPNSAIASPGLAQLVDMGNLDDDMSLSALMKLRRGAWGGSNGSLRSSAGSPPPHTISPSHRASLNGAEASPTVSELRPFGPDEGAPNSVGYFYDDARAASALSGRLDYEEVPTSGPPRLDAL